MSMQTYEIDVNTAATADEGGVGGERDVHLELERRDLQGMLGDGELAWQLNERLVRSQA